MNRLTIMLFISLSLIPGCGPSESVRLSNQANVQSDKTVDNRPTGESNAYTADPWLPQAVENCINSVRDDFVASPSRNFNPFYLRLDFDGDGVADHAVLVQRQSGDGTVTNGLLVCRENRETGIFGAILEGSKPLTSFERDNFVTGNWEAIPKADLNEYARNERGKSRIQGIAKGDVVGFFHEGGAVYIMWDGNNYRIVEGS